MMPKDAWTLKVMGAKKIMFPAFTPWLCLCCDAPFEVLFAIEQMSRPDFNREACRRVALLYLHEIDSAQGIAILLFL